MIEEDYVSFETAKLLKEKGFDGECDLFGRTDETELIIREVAKIAYSQGIDDECIILPTLQMAMKWLREVYNINLNISWSPSFKDYFVEIFKPTLLYSTATYRSYEEACETAIKYCLENLI